MKKRIRYKEIKIKRITLWFINLFWFNKKTNNSPMYGCKLRGYGYRLRLIRLYEHLNRW